VGHANAKKEWLRRDIAFWQVNARASRYRAGALAMLIGVTPRHLQRVFRDRFGVTPQAWIDGYRLEQARDMLASGRPVKVVAFELEFRQLSHFSRKFKARFGCAPSTWSCRAEIRVVVEG